MIAAGSSRPASSLQSSLRTKNEGGTLMVVSERVATATNLLDGLRSRVSDYLPCVLMMYKCLKCGISPSDRKNEVEHDGRNDAWNDVGDGPDLAVDRRRPGSRGGCTH